jgi:hypothetical protein
LASREGKFVHFLEGQFSILVAVHLQEDIAVCFGLAAGGQEDGGEG